MDQRAEKAVKKEIQSEIMKGEVRYRTKCYSWYGHGVRNYKYIFIYLSRKQKKELSV